MTKKTVKHMMLVLMILVIGIYFISGTYARYASTATGTSTAAVAKWAVSVKDVETGTATDMVENSEFTLTFKEVPNANVVDGKIAPASQLVSSLVIDPTGSEVAMDYKIELGKVTDAAGNDLSDKIKISDVTVGGSSVELTDGSVVEGTIKLTSQDKALTSADAVTVDVYVEWADETLSTDPTDANNVSDTELGVTAPTIKMEVTATALQHISTPQV